jgi:hypothetical protein
MADEFTDLAITEKNTWFRILRHRCGFTKHSHGFRWHVTNNSQQAIDHPGLSRHMPWLHAGLAQPCLSRDVPDFVLNRHGFGWHRHCPPRMPGTQVSACINPDPDGTSLESVLTELR